MLAKIIGSPLTLSLIVTAVVAAISAFYLFKSFETVSMDRRINQALGEAQVIDVDSLANIDIISREDRVDSTISKIFPSLRKTQLSLRRAGNIMSIRVYVLVVLFGAFAAAVFIPQNTIPTVCMPVVSAILLHFLMMWLVLPKLIVRRQAQILRQMPEMVDFVVRTLVIGQSLEAAIGEVGKQIGAPLAKEIEIIPKLIAVGVPLTQALTVTAAEMDSPEFEFFAAACVAQIESGGDLSSVLRSLSETIRGRLGLFNEINAMTAEGKVSAYFLGALPLALLAYLSYSNKTYMEPIYSTSIGHMILYGIFTLVAVGTYVALKIVSVKA